MTTIMAQHMTITDYNDNNGIIPIQIGKTRVSTGYHRLLHIIDLKNYDPIILNINELIVKQHTLITNNTKLTLLFQNKNVIIARKANGLANTLNFIKPRRLTRQKRGLIDGLGSIIRTITGNLDQTDYREISDALSNINHNEEIITQKINEQISLNDKMLARFKEIQQTINKEIKENTRLLGMYKTQTIDMLEISSFEQFLYTLDYQIDRLQTHLDDILNTIIHARLGIVSHHLLNKEELHFIDNHLRLQKVNINSEYNLYQFIKLKAYYNQTLIIFSIEIPNFDKNTYKQFHILPTIINQTYTIHIPNPSILLNDYTYQYNNKPCQQIEEYFYCEQDGMQTNNSSCITQIILTKPAKCDLIRTTMEDKITHIFQQYIYVQTLNQMDYITNCGIQNKKYFRGIQLIKFSNCTITINNTNYENSETTFFENLLNFEPYHDITIQNIITPVEMATLNNWTINNIAEIKELKRGTTTNTYHFISIWSTSIILMSIIIIYLLCQAGYFKKSIKSSQLTLDDHKTQISRSSLRGEELHPSAPQQQQPIFLALNNHSGNNIK